MSRKQPKNTTGSLPELALSMAALQGKQSVRATFTLPKHIIDLLGIVASQLGVKQKSLFDQLVEDTGVLDQVAEEALEYTPAREGRRQKTFVLSRRSLISLEVVSREQQIPRDILVEYSIQRLLPVIAAEQEKHEKRKLLYDDMRTYLRQGEKLLKKANALLDNDDRVLMMIKNLVALCEKNTMEIETILEKGNTMAQFE